MKLYPTFTSPYKEEEQREAWASLPWEQVADSAIEN
jgi:hypothetical protein